MHGFGTASVVKPLPVVKKWVSARLAAGLSFAILDVQQLLALLGAEHVGDPNEHLEIAGFHRGF